MNIDYGTEFDERTVFELPLKGWYPGVTITTESGTKFSLVFYDPARLAQDIEAEQIICDKNLVVIPEVTKEWIDRAIAKMVSAGYFT